MLNAKNSLLMIIDIQQKLLNALKPYNNAIQEQNAVKIVRAAKTLGIDILVTQQYTKGLGATIESITDILGAKYKPFEKTYFSAVKEDEIYKAIVNSGKKQIVLIGIEAHICVFQTAVELFEKGYEVYVAADCCFSIKESEKTSALQNLRHLNIQTPTFESILFMWLEGSKNPYFKQLQALIK